MSLQRWAIAALMTTSLATVGAIATAQNHPSAAEIARITLQHLERQDLAAIEQLLAPNARFDNMLLLPNMPGTFQGRDAVMANLQHIVENFDRIEFVDERVFPAQDGRTVFVEARGNFLMKGTGEPYRNLYVFAFEVQNGQVTAVREYNNPLTIAETFNLPIVQPAEK